jgi:hypothetical protein
MVGDYTQSSAEHTGGLRVRRPYPSIGCSRDAAACPAQVGAKDAVALSPPGDSAQPAYPHHPVCVVATLADASFRCQVRGRATSPASRARVYAGRRARGAEHSAIGESARPPAEASAHAALLARQWISCIAVRAHRPVRGTDPSADRRPGTPRAPERSIEVSAVGTDAAGGTDPDQRRTALAICTGWRHHRRVAIGNQHVRQAHNSAWTRRFRVEDTVAVNSQIRIDLIERFRTIYTSSLQEVVGIGER